MARWILKSAVLAAHDEQLAEHGGMVGIKDEGALESALDRPRNKAANGDPSLPELAAAYAYGLARNHAFSDGNKRTSLVVAESFLALNGLMMTADDSEIYKVWMDLAAGRLTEDDLAVWIAARIQPL